MNVQCIKCKGRNLCKRKFCPVLTKINSQKKMNITAKQDFFGKAPNVFVGRFGYPNINVGILGVEGYAKHDEPLYWSKKKYEIQQIIELRTQLVNSNFTTGVLSVRNSNSGSASRFLETSKELSLSYKPVDVEISLNKKPNFNLTFNQDTMPHGPNVRLEKARITENPKIPHIVDKMVSDNGIKAADAINILYKKKFDEHYLTKVLSVGNLGVGLQRKLVPTRWSITAVDDTIGKEITTKIKDNTFADYAMYSGSYLGNYYIILFFPEVWGYELFETALGDKVSFATDHETFAGRKEYANHTAGGYYAARLAVLEELNRTKKQATTMAFRFISPTEYWAPLGVWVVREAARNTMKNKPIQFASKELMINYARETVKKRFNFDLDVLLKESKLYKELKTQQKLSMY